MAVTVQDVMVPSPVTVARGDAIGSARATLKSSRFSALPVVDSDGGLIGIVTQRDLIRCEEPDDVPVSRIMSAGVFTVAREADVRLAAQIMRCQELHHVVVTDENEDICGIVSSFDLLRLIEEESAAVEGGDR